MLRSSDSFVIAGCTLNVSGAPHPCVTVQLGHHGRAQHDRRPDPDDRLASAFAWPPTQAIQGPVNIVSTQTAVSGE